MAKGKLTRDQMERVIAKRGSVMVGNRIITRVQDLPSRAELAAGDPEAEARTAAEIDADIARLQADRDRLTTAPAAKAARQEKEPAAAATGGKDDGSKDPKAGK